jgi:hypothetical protein
MHVVEFLKVAMYVVIFGFFWRLISARCADKPIGQAMAYIY